jgi:hypothetical protein
MLLGGVTTAPGHEEESQALAVAFIIVAIVVENLHTLLLSGPVTRESKAGSSPSRRRAI